MNGARILLCVTGGIAAYKAAALTSTLVQRGARVDVAMTPAAERFVGAVTFAALTARPVFTSLWDLPERIAHIRLVRDAQVVLVVPASADVIAKLANGIADDLVTTALLAARVPILIAPAMNDAMYRHPATQQHLQTLRERGCTIIEPESGFLAEREHGIGRLAEQARILEALEALLARTQSLTGKRVLITAGPTRESLDPVRFFSNASTGSTGIALAQEAAARGADVTLLLGPTMLQPPANVGVVPFTTAQELCDAAMLHAPDADLAIATAAVSDWRPAESYEHKVKKSDGDLQIRMVRNPDVLSAIGERKKAGAFIVGFAAETAEHERHARQKLVSKRLDAIAVNDVSAQRGFGTGPNALTVLWGTEGKRDLGESAKSVLAARLLDCIEELMRARRD